MALLTNDCPRCGVGSVTFEVKALCDVPPADEHECEIFAQCRRCKKSTIFRLYKIQSGRDILNNLHNYSTTYIDSYVIKRGHVTLKDNTTHESPEHLPAPLKSAFDEGVTCLAAECWNAAGLMFRKVLDLATKSMLPDEGEPGGPTTFQRKNLGPRMGWLLETGRLARDLATLAECIREDGNDGAHAEPLTAEDAQDLYDFTFVLLERLYTEPQRLQLAEQRRTQRRSR